MILMLQRMLSQLMPAALLSIIFHVLCSHVVNYCNSIPVVA